jgi:hypothetical protein
LGSGVGVNVAVAVDVGVGVSVGVAVFVGVGVLVGVGVFVGVLVRVAVAVLVGVAVAAGLPPLVAVGWPLRVAVGALPSQAMPLPSLSKWCGSGGRTRKLPTPMSSQFRSGGGGGIQKSG